MPAGSTGSGDGDHDNGVGHEYMWWLIQKVADLHNHPPYFLAAQVYERSVGYPNGHRNVIMPRRGIRPLPRGGLPGHGRGRLARHQVALPVPQALRRHLRLAHQRRPTWGPTGATTTRSSSRSSRSTRGTGTTTNTSAPALGHRKDPDRRLPARGVHLERVREGLSLRVPELERPRQHPPELRRRPHRRRLAAGDHRGVQEAAQLRRDRQHHPRRPQRCAPDGRHLRHQREAGPGDRRSRDRPGRQAPRDPRQQVRLLDRARHAPRSSSATRTTTPGPARRTITTSGSNRPTATSPGPRRCGSLTNSEPSVAVVLY